LSVKSDSAVKRGAEKRIFYFFVNVRGERRYKHVGNDFQLVPDDFQLVCVGHLNFSFFVFVRERGSAAPVTFGTSMF
jgi:hypothetical protein